VSLPLSRGLLWPLFFCLPYAFDFLLLRLRQHTAHSARIPFVTEAVSHTGQRLLINGYRYHHGHSRKYRRGTQCDVVSRPALGLLRRPSSVIKLITRQK
jgi:hypothetical protein